jgi:putative protease
MPPRVLLNNELKSCSLMTKIELLAPAKNLDSGMLAINYGADAVYIGSANFGARAAASNSVGDIEKLVRYAHKYAAKVYVAFNTILYDQELEHAQKLIHQLYQAGADALIIQDLGILQMDLPDIPLHASTQTNNYQLDRIKFLDDLNFDRIILARELSLKEIRTIRSQTKSELEYFVHGALCVSLSGQCYFSQVVTGRSANRGQCSQMCRHPYNLVDANGKKILLNSHLLSLKDLNLSNQLEELVQAGITSLKIEGRLKDANYVKNVVSYYRQKLDKIFTSHPEFTKASSGLTKINFEPDPERSFNRQSTNYFLSGRQKGLINPNSPKSMGKEIGVAEIIANEYIKVKTSDTLHNGDGLCFIKNNELIGFRVEKTEGNKVFVNDSSIIPLGAILFRNYDHEFNKLLDADQSVRKISASIHISDMENKIVVQLTDSDSLSSEYIIEQLPELAKNKELADKNLVSQLSKSGNSMFEITEVKNFCRQAYFFRISDINEIRRILFDKHEQFRIASFARKDVKFKRNNVAFPKHEVNFAENIANLKAAEFYKEHLVEKQEPALEISTTKENQLLMTTRYCIKYELGYCHKFQSAKNTPAEPLYIEDNNRKYLLEFDCKNCLMNIRLSIK